MIVIVRKFLFLVLCFGVLPADAKSLVGSELSFRVIFQASPLDKPQVVTFPATAIVSEDEVEFPNAASFFDPNAPLPPEAKGMTNIQIDVTSNAVEISFKNIRKRSYFIEAFRNTSILTFEKKNEITLADARIDHWATNLALSQSRLSVAGNELHINFESLHYDETSFVRIILKPEFYNKKK